MRIRQPIAQSRLSRRSLLKGSVAVALGAAVLPSARGAAVEQPARGKVIDCHAHLTHHSRATWEADDRKLIEAADKLGIDQLCCSILTPHWPATLDGFRECNQWTGRRRCGASPGECSAIATSIQATAGNRWTKSAATWEITASSASSSTTSIPAPSRSSFPSSSWRSSWACRSFTMRPFPLLH